MFVVIYSFEIKDKKVLQFINSWKKLTELIYQYEGSLGSRLHKQNPKHYIAYAQWPNKQLWLHSGDHLPPEANEIRKQMKDSCTKIETLYQLDVIEDLLQ